MTTQISGDTGVSQVQDNTVTSAKIVAGAVGPSDLAQPLTSRTAVATTSGTSIDFTGIPSWVKRITVLFDAVSLSGTDSLLVQVGTGGSPTITGYSSGSGSVSTAVANATAGIESTSGYIIRAPSAAVIDGAMTIYTFGSNKYISTHVVSDPPGASLVTSGAGNITLASVLDMVRVTVTGTNTFDAGSINIMYE